MKVDIVPHPLSRSTAITRKEPSEPLPWKGKPHIALLPGSRSHEIKRMLPVMWTAAALIEKLFPDASFIIAAPNEDIAELIERLLARMRGGPTSGTLITGKTRQVLKQARAAMVASGTATIEAAMMRCPMVVIYKTAWATYLAGRLLIRLPFLGMVNIMAGRRLCQELIQHKAVPSALAKTLAGLIPDGSERDEMLLGLDEIILALNGTGANAADIVLSELERKGES